MVGSVEISSKDSVLLEIVKKVLVPMKGFIKMLVLRVRRLAIGPAGRTYRNTSLCFQA